MALLDMSDLLASAEFQDTISVISTTRVVGSNGIPTDTSALPVAMTVIAIPDGQSMIRQADGSYLSAAITIYSQARLYTGTKANDTTSRLADIVVWHGGNYVVRQCADYSAFGQGFWRTSAELIQLNPAA